MTTKWTDLEKIVGRPGPFAAESFSADAAKVNFLSQQKMHSVFLFYNFKEKNSISFSIEIANDSSRVENFCSILLSLAYFLFSSKNSKIPFFSIFHLEINHLGNIWVIFGFQNNLPSISKIFS